MPSSCAFLPVPASTLFVYNLGCTIQVDDVGVLQIARCCPLLRCANFNRCEWGCVLLAAFCQPVDTHIAVRLSLRCCTRLSLSDDSLVPLVRNAHHLYKLLLVGCSKVCPAFCRNQTLAACDPVQWVVTHWTPQITSKLVVEICLNCPKLQLLDISGCHHVLKPSLEAAAQGLQCVAIVIIDCCCGCSS